MVIAISFFIVLAAIVICFLRDKRSWPTAPSFDDRFPPISDEEFLARCSPGTDPRIALRVRRIVSEKMGVRYEQVYPSTRFNEDLNAG